MRFALHGEQSRHCLPIPEPEDLAEDSAEVPQAEAEQPEAGKEIEYELSKMQNK